MNSVVKVMISDEPVSRGHLIRIALQLVATGAASYFLYKYIDKVLQLMDPTKKSKKALEKKVTNYNILNFICLYVYIFFYRHKIYYNSLVDQIPIH